MDKNDYQDHPNDRPNRNPGTRPEETYGRAGNFLNLNTGCFSSIKTLDNLSSYLHNILEGTALFENYFVHFKDSSGKFCQICDFKSGKSLATIFEGLPADEQQYWGSQNEQLSEVNPLKIFNVSQLVAKGRVEPWMFFLNRVGIKEIVARHLNFGGNGIGIFWYVPRSNDSKISNFIPALLSGAIASFQQLQLNQTLPEQSFASGELHSCFQEEAKKVIIGQGPAMQKLNLLINKVAPSYATVLIFGETGTGKELVANEIHHQSERKGKPFIKINCAAIPLHLIESELFGHEKGSFTGATDRRIGKFELANGGTIFLDEIGEMAPSLQVKLLRVLQEKEIERIGSSKSIKVDVRIIAATSRDLSLEVTQGRFRSDLFYRLNVFSIAVPPLRDRVEDLSLLCEYFLNKYAISTTPHTLSQYAFKQITEYHWPGNVRELEHFIERSILVASGQVLEAVYLPEKQEQPGIPRIETHFKTLEDMERNHLRDALRLSLGRISGKNGAAELLGLAPSTLSSKLLRLNIDRNEFDSP